MQFSDRITIRPHLSTLTAKNFSIKLFFLESSSTFLTSVLGGGMTSTWVSSSEDLEVLTSVAWLSSQELRKDKARSLGKTFLSIFTSGIALGADLGGWQAPWASLCCVSSSVLGDSLWKYSDRVKQISTSSVSARCLLKSTKIIDEPRGFKARFEKTRKQFVFA